MSKAKGSRAERRCIKALEAEGFVCTKAGGSLGVFDVIGIGPASFRAIQVKARHVETLPRRTGGHVGDSRAAERHPRVLALP